MALYGTPVSSAVDLRILLPLYAYPDASSTVYSTVAAAGSNVSIVAIINPDNGPGAGFPNSDYVTAMQTLNAGGVTMIGYVYSSFGTRDTNAIRADVDAYAANPLIKGIFIDEVPTDSAYVGYYQGLYAYIHSKPRLATVVLNPGTQLPEAYLSRPAGDVAVIFEDAAGWSTYSTDAYVAKRASAQFGVLCYGVGAASTMQTDIDLAVRRNAQWIYVTDRGSGATDPWDGLPSYWNQLVQWVGAYRNLSAASISGSAQGARVSFHTLSNRSYRIEYSTNPLVATSWTSLTATALSTASVVQALDTNTAAPAKYYRLKLIP